MDKITPATVVLQATSADGKTTLPVVLRHNIGAGTIITVLQEDDGALYALGILPHLLSRIASDVLPFEVVDDGGADLLPTKLELLTARRASGWQVTLVNNNGVTKQPSSATVLDPSQRLSANVRLKRAYGVVASAMVVTGTVNTTLSTSNNTITVIVEAGDLVVLNIELD